MNRMPQPSRPFEGWTSQLPNPKTFLTPAIGCEESTSRRGPWCPAFENHESWGNSSWNSHTAKLGQPPCANHPDDFRVPNSGPKGMPVLGRKRWRCPKSAVNLVHYCLDYGANGIVLLGLWSSYEHADHLMCSLKYGAFGHKVLHMENAETVQIRLLEESDPPSIAAAFTNMGWNKPETQYRR
jgi:hypothetical protein